MIFGILLILIQNYSVYELGNQGIEISFTGEKLNSENFAFSGAHYICQPGEPNLPSFEFIIGIPQDGDVEVAVIRNEEGRFFGVEVQPVIPLAIYEEPVPEKIEIHGEVYKRDRFFPDGLFQITKKGYFRDIYTVNLRVNPIRYNPVKKELLISRNLKLRVKFKGVPRSLPVLDNSFEQIYSRTIINYNQCKNWRRERIPQNIKNPFSIGAWFKVEVDTEGLYKIGYEELKKGGIDPKQFDPKTLKIYTAAFELLPQSVTTSFADSLIEVPVYVEGEDDHKFDRDDYLVFYGFPASHFIPDTNFNWFENGYARSTVYWLTFGGSYGRRMARVEAIWNGTNPDTVVNEILHYEEDVHNPTRSGINWFWQDISIGSAESTGTSFVLHHPEALGPAGIRVAVFDSMIPSIQPFWVRVYMGNSTFISDTVLLPKVLSLPPYYLYGNGFLTGDSSEFGINFTRPSGTNAELTCYLNSIDLKYKRLTDVKRPFHAFFNTPTPYTICCSNVKSRLFILDITDLKMPRIFEKFSSSGDKATFSSRCDSFQLLFIAQLNSAIPSVLRPANPGKLRQADAGCEYLFITHKNFYSSLLPLVNYRRQMYTTKVVTVDAIFDDFSFGKYDPLALKHFLYFAYNNWTTVPKFVLIVGDATYDYKNNLKKDNPPNFVPMYEAGTSLSGNPGIPPNYIYEGECVNFFGNEAMILGRITVRTNQELRDFIDKLIAYETCDIDGIWNKRVLLTSDDEYADNYLWEGFLHVKSTEKIANFVIPDTLYDIAKLYMISYPPFTYPTKKPNAMEDFIKELSKGFIAGCFFGHGNTHQLAHEGLFFDTQVPFVKNGKKLFFFYFASCTVGRFDDSDYECIAEELVRIKEGAIGTMGAHKGSSSGGNESLGVILFDLITNPDTNLTMGECYHIAKHTPGTGGVAVYLLIGDPATNLRKVRMKKGLFVTPDSVRPMERLKIAPEQKPFYLSAFIRDTTHIEYIAPSTANKISGHIYRLVQTGNNSWAPYDYEILGKEIYQGYWDSDTAQIIVPSVSTSHLPVIRLSSYKNRTSGYRDSIRVYGTASPATDNSGPEIILFEAGRRLKDGDWVDKDFILTGVVSDESGINLLNSREDARGFFFYIGKDNITNRIDLRNYFTYHKNSWTSGEFQLPVSLENREDSITVCVSDNRFNQSIKKVVLHTELYNRISIENILVYPNPIRDEREILFTFYLTHSGQVQIKVFTIAGRLIKTIPARFCNAGYNQIPWNGLDEYGNRLANGVYLVQVVAESDENGDKVTEKFIIAR
uniref:T9SS type A sorting domain-containing protein n=1 Tax=candidate division WOR-3 bacterium TaxID=2052148 RepID=A0A7C4TD42_UNCW3